MFKTTHCPSAIEYWEQLYNKSSEDILTEVLNNRSIYDECIKNLHDFHDGMYFFVGIVSKIASLPYSVEKTKILSTVCSSELWEELVSFIMLLPSHISTSAEASGKTLWKNIDTFLINTMFCCICFFDVASVSAIDKIPKIIHGIHLTISNLESESFKIADGVKEQLTTLEEKLEMCIAELNERQSSDFRKISIYPTSEEILQFRPSFLKKNKIVGRYKDVNEYLDIHFRLLREDFVKPLREGVKEYLSQQQRGASIRERNSSVKVHKNVKFLEIVYTNGEVGRKIQLDRKCMDFIYGGLLCFTRNHFITMIFGRVVSADHDLLSKRQLIVSLDTKSEGVCSDTYTMIECNVFFQPYYVVLKSLQRLEDSSFPLKQFIVDVCPTIHSPKYLQADTKYKIDEHSVRVLDKKWPDEKNFELNPMQYEGFKTALTKELVIIQGPPGTGKTHLGLKIVKVILNNKSYWCKKKNQHQTTSGPMLVLCYTNHALDQFLEGILKFTTSVVRVGGRSKSEMLKPYNLKELLKDLRVKEDIISMKRDLRDTALEIKKLNNTLDIIKQCGGVIDFHEFENIEPEFKSSWFAKTSASKIKQWLTGNINTSTYIRQLEWQHFKKHKSKLHFDSPNKGSLSQTFLQTTDNDANKRIEVYSDFDLINAQDVQPKLTVDFKRMQEKLTDYLAKQHILTDVLVKDRETVCRWRKLGLIAKSLEDDVKYVQIRLLQGKDFKCAKKPTRTDFNSLIKMKAGERWGLYFYWLNLYEKWAVDRIKQLAHRYQEMFVEYEKRKALRDVNLMRKCDVIGMTTTGGARLQNSLQKLECPIVVVEEAAEILESHIVASLTKDCQHLILIGDHQQLRPKTADYNIEKDMQLGISLFERFIMNKFKYCTLNIQHRMRPEISSLICPAIYPGLIDHLSVFNYPLVKGVSSSVYFIDHCEEEAACGNSSKKNLHEAKFLARLAQYLWYNGYAAKDITILVAYMGQYFAVMQELAQLRLKDVPCAVLDNYQGEESKIVLLSLVRNNNNNRIGFLQSENRVCVALSRAKEGLYIMGNMELLCRNSKIWPKIKDALVAQNALGEYLEICCQVHLDRIVKVKHHNDFDQVPYGCCGQNCRFELRCGHKCELLCHVQDLAHTDYKCRQPCLATCKEDTNHVCKKLCFQECGLCEYEVERTLPCGHTHKMPCHTNVATYKCNELITTSLPDCGHAVILACYKKLSDFTCTFPCDKRLEKCGHACTLTCHVNKDPEHKEYQCKQRCSKDAANCSLVNKKHRCKNKCYKECEPCSESVKKQKASCGHVFKVPCSKNVDDYVKNCSYPCEKLLQCGHLCQNKCGDSCTTACKETVERVSFICGHNIACVCSDENFEENAQCKERVVMTKPAACGHKFGAYCYVVQLSSDDPVKLAFCPEKCTSVLACGHPCTGTCFECYQGRFHTACTAPCEKSLICGHQCQLTCGKPCEPCFRKCSFSCVHRKWTSICGQECFKCDRKCPRSCVHATCSARCSYEYCTVTACMRRCPKTLACGHRCAGYCGDVCPTCVICEGGKVKRHDKYITLQECGHVFEIKEIKELLEKHNPVGIKMCPLCKVPLFSTHRLKDYIWNGINERQYMLMKIYANFNQSKDSLFIEGLTPETFMQINKNIITATENACFQLKKEILMMLSNHLQTVKKLFINARYIYHYEAAQFLKTTERFFMSPTFTMQEAIDVLNEFKRCINKLDLIVILVTFDPLIIDTDFKSLYKRSKVCLDDQQQRYVDKVISLLFSMRPFNNENDIAVKETLKSLNKFCNLKETLFKNGPSIPEIMNCSSESWFRCSQGHLIPCGGEEDRSCRICEKNNKRPNLQQGKFKGKNNRRFSKRK